MWTTDSLMTHANTHTSLARKSQVCARMHMHMHVPARTCSRARAHTHTHTARGGGLAGIDKRGIDPGICDIPPSMRRTRRGSWPTQESGPHIAPQVHAVPTTDLHFCIALHTSNRLTACSSKGRRSRLSTRRTSLKSPCSAFSMASWAIQSLNTYLRHQPLAQPFPPWFSYLPQ
jgi:hypothetical protein